MFIWILANECSEWTDCMVLAMLSYAMLLQYHVVETQFQNNKTIMYSQYELLQFV